MKCITIWYVSMPTSQHTSNLVGAGARAAWDTVDFKEKEGEATDRPRVPVNAVRFFTAEAYSLTIYRLNVRLDAVYASHVVWKLRLYALTFCLFSKPHYAGEWVRSLCSATRPGDTRGP